MKLLVAVQNFLKSEKGQTMAEYGLILVLIAIVVIIAVTGIGTQLDVVFSNIATQLGGS